MSAKVVLLTGATSGIGAVAAELLLPRFRVVVLHGPESADDYQPELERLQRIAVDLRPDAEVHYLRADYSDPAQVRSLADAVAGVASGIDLLINNAAIPGPPRRTIGRWRVEQGFGVDYLAPTLLTDLLLPVVERAAGVIVNVSSATHASATLDLDDLEFRSRSYTPVQSYAQAKLAVVTHSSRLARHTSAKVLSLHPGVVATPLLHAMFRVSGHPAASGAANVVAAAESSAPSGSYLDETTPSSPNWVAERRVTQVRLHEVTCELLGRDIA